GSRRSRVPRRATPAASARVSPTSPDCFRRCPGRCTCSRDPCRGIAAFEPIPSREDPTPPRVRRAPNDDWAVDDQELAAVTTTYDPFHPKYFDEADLREELTRVYDLCHGCRLCFKFCTSFPTLFEYIDQIPDQDAAKLTPAQQDQVVE